MVDRSSLINQIYYQELGRIGADQGGLDYWRGRTDLTDEALRQQIRGAGLGPNVGESVVAPLLADNNYSQFLRGMQFNESQIQSNLQAAQEAARRRITGQAGQYDLQRQQGLQNVDESFESRGMYRSGGRLAKAGEVQRAVDLNQRQFEEGIYEGTAQMERDAAQKIADMRRQRAEEELGARVRLTEGSAQA